MTGSSDKMNILAKSIIKYCYRRRALHWLSLILIRRWDGEDMHSPVLREMLKWHDGVSIGRYSYGPILKWGRLPRGTRVGNWVSVGRELLVVRRNHPTDRVTQHPFFYNAKLGVVSSDTIEEVTDNPLEIGHDVWIGDRVTILGSCGAIGNGAIVAAGAVVTRDVPPYAIMVGIPAKPLRDRFPPEVQRHLEESRWWEFDLATLTTLQPFLMQSLTPELAAEFAERCRALREKGG